MAQQDFPALTARYDLVLAHRMDHSPRWPEERVAVIPLAHEPLDVALPAGHRLAGQRAVTADDVVGEPWVTSRAGYSPADVLSAVAAVSSRELNIVHRINDYSTVAALVAAGGVIGLLPRHTARPVLNPDIVLRPLEGISTRRRIDILARPENLKRTSVRMVCEALQTIMTELRLPTGSQYGVLRRLLRPFDAEPLQDQLADAAGVGLAAGGLHDAADDRADGLDLAAADLLRDVGLRGEGRVDGFQQRAVVGDHGEAALLDDLRRGAFAGEHAVQDLRRPSCC